MIKTESEYVHYTLYHLMPVNSYAALPGEVVSEDRAEHVKDGMGCLLDLVNRHNSSYPERHISQDDLETLQRVIRNRQYNPGRLLSEDDLKH